MTRSLFAPLAILLASAALATGCGDPCADSGTICTVLGTGAPGAAPGETDPMASPLYGPMEVTADPADASSFFVGDWNNHKIKRVKDGEVDIAIGTIFLGDGDPDFHERVAPGAHGKEVALNHPTQMEWNPFTGMLLIPSWHNHRVRQWDPATGNSLVVAANTDTTDGNGANSGFAGDGGPAGQALMGFPNSIAVDPDDGSFWLLAQRNQRIRKITADFTMIETIAGTGEAGLSGDGGDALAAEFNFWDAADLQPEPAGAIEYDGVGLLYVADTSNHTIRVIDTATNVIETLPDLPVQTLPGGNCSPDALCFPRDIELGPDGRLWIADTDNHLIRAYDLTTHELSTMVGSGEKADGEEGATGAEISLNRPYGIDFAADGALLIADTYNHRIRRMTP